MSDETDLPETSRLQAKFFGPVSPRIRIDFGALSHPGLVRSNNEDHYAVVRRYRGRDVLLSNMPAGALPPSVQEVYVMVAADGMGGSSFGEVASMLALRSAWDLTSGAFKWHFNLTPGEEFAEAEEIIKLKGKLMHRSLQDAAQQRPELKGMGTTIAAVIVAGFEAVVAHAGDSRVYVLRAGRLHLLTRDHTLAEFVRDAGQFALEAQESLNLRSVLVNCLGGHDEHVEIETSRLKLLSEDRLLVCTDGLTDLVSEPDISEVLSAAVDPQAAAAALVELALRNGGRDNVTVVTARIRDFNG